MDVDNLVAGQRFDRELQNALAQTDVFLAVIGPRWSELFLQQNRRQPILNAGCHRALVITPIVDEYLPHRSPSHGSDAGRALQFERA